MTQSAFLAFYPQFQIYAQGVVLTEYIQQANARFSDFDEDAEEARRLFVAQMLHKMGETVAKKHRPVVQV